MKYWLLLMAAIAAIAVAVVALVIARKPRRRGRTGSTGASVTGPTGGIGADQYSFAAAAQSTGSDGLWMAVGSGNPQTNELAGSVLVGQNIEVTEMVVYQSAASGVSTGDAYTYTLRVNGTDEDASVTIADVPTGTSGALSIAVESGERLSVQITVEGSPDAVSSLCAVKYRPLLA
jgi:hypothetical protein